MALEAAPYFIDVAKNILIPIAGGDKTAPARYLVGLGSFCYTTLYIDVCGLFPATVRQPMGLPNINISATC